MRRMAIAVLLVLANGLLVAAGARPCLRPKTELRPTRGQLGDPIPMPADNVAAGWARAGNPRLFTKADLYGYIDGGAELFLEFGFDQLSLQKYRNGSREIAVEIYRMADPPAAMGVYLMKCGRETPDVSFKVRHTLNRHQLMLVRNRYYVTINNLSGVDGLGPTLVDFGRAVSNGLPVDRALTVPALPAAGQLPGSLRFVRGQFSLQSIYTLGEGDILQLGGKLLGASANYKDTAGNYTLLLVNYPSPAAAKGAFENVRKDLDKYLKATTATSSRLVFRDYENKFGVVLLVGSRIDIRLHLANEPK